MIYMHKRPGGMNPGEFRWDKYSPLTDTNTLL